MSTYLLAFFLIFGLGHPARQPLDPDKSVPLHSRLKCDGYGSPEDLLRIQVTYSPGAWAREFEVNQFDTDKCGVETMFQCWHKPRAGWHNVWSAANEQPAVREGLPLVTSQNASATGTNLDGYFSEGHGLSTFALEGGAVYHCYSSYARGTEFLMGYYAVLDRAPKGRDEGDQPMSWLRRHNEYESK